MHNDLIDLLNRLSNEIDNLRTVLHSMDNIAREVDSGACSAPPDKAVPGTITIAPGEWYEYNPGPPVAPWSSGLIETRTELK